MLAHQHLGPGPLTVAQRLDHQLMLHLRQLQLAVLPVQRLAVDDEGVRGFLSIRAYPVEERHGFVWIWPGDPEKADPSLIPELHWADSPDWAYGGGLYHIQCDYRLMIDNLMDLTHET